MIRLLSVSGTHTGMLCTDNMHTRTEMRPPFKNDYYLNTLDTLLWMMGAPVARYARFIDFSNRRFASNQNLHF